MPRRVVLTALVAVVAVPALGASSAQAAARCGNLPFAQSRLVVFDVRADGTSCRTARRVASRWRSKAGCGTLPAGGPTTCGPILRYRCRRTGSSGEVVRLRCAKGRKVVRFAAGA